MEDLRDFRTYLLDPKDPKSDNTVSPYVYAAQEFLDKAANPKEITKKDIDGYIAFLNSDGLKRNTKLLRLAGIKSYLGYREEGDLKLYIEKTKFKPKKNDKKKIDYFEVFGEIEKLRQKDKFASPRDRLIFYILTEAGLRVSEMLSLSIEDFDLKNRKIVFWQEKQATEGEADLTENIAKALKKYEAKDKLFNFSRQAVDQILKSYYPKLCAHRLRHYYISQWAKRLPPYLLQVKSRHKSFKAIESYVNLGARDVDSYLKEKGLKRPF